jgi:Lon protease-like protein
VPSELEDEAERTLASALGPQSKLCSLPLLSATTYTQIGLAQHMQPTNEELIAICHAFLEQLRNGTAPWVVQRLNYTYGPMPTDPCSFSFWMALVLPIDEHEKAKLLPIKSARLRLRLVVHWIEQLNSNW